MSRRHGGDQAGMTSGQTPEAEQAGVLIGKLHRASDRYGQPHMIRFLERYHHSGFLQASCEELREYIREEGIEH